MAKRHNKRSTKRHKAAKKPRKMAAKGTRKTAKRGKRSAKPAKRARKPAKAAPSHPIMIPINIATEKLASLPSLPAKPLGYSRDSFVNALAAVLILFALIGAGILYPQPKPHQSLSAPAPAVMQKK